MLLISSAVKYTTYACRPFPIQDRKVDLNLKSAMTEAITLEVKSTCAPGNSGTVDVSSQLATRFAGDGSRVLSESMSVPCELPPR